LFRIASKIILVRKHTGAIMSTSGSFQEEKAVVPLARVRALKGKLKVCATGGYTIIAPNGPC
jgi:hypothetical protein